MFLYGLIVFSQTEETDSNKVKRYNSNFVDIKNIYIMLRELLWYVSIFISSIHYVVRVHKLKLLNLEEFLLILWSKF